MAIQFNNVLSGGATSLIVDPNDSGTGSITLWWAPL